MMSRSARALAGLVVSLGALAAGASLVPPVATAGVARVQTEAVAVGSQGEEFQTSLVFVARGPESNSLSVGEPRDVDEDEITSEVRLSDRTAPIRPGRGCRADGESAVVCTLELGVNGIVARLGSGRDTFRVSGVLSAAVFGGRGNDLILGADGSDFVDPGEGRDLVRTFAGEDTISDRGGRGDVLDGGTGRFDYIDYSRRRRGVRVDLARRVGGERGERDRLRGIENVVGGRGDDVILGDKNRNRLEEGEGLSEPGGPVSGFTPGPTGDDLFRGRGGGDRVQSLNGDDRLVGGPGGDQLACQLNVRQRCRLFGGPGRDRLYGGDGPDLLRGGPGRDLLVGFRGNDLLLARDRQRDSVAGRDGYDRAQLDPIDGVSGIESRLIARGGRASAR